MVESLIKVLGTGLELWKSKESRKYIDKLIELKRDYYEESNLIKPDMAKLDNIKFELRLLGEAFASEVGKQDSIS